MGRRGPVPPPQSKLRILDREEIPAPQGAPTCPDWLSDSGHEQWYLVVAELGDLVNEIDRNALGVYAQTIADYKDNLAFIVKEGWLVPGDRGLVKNPRSQIVRELRDSILAYSREFGLTPFSRAKLKTPGEKAADPLGDFAACKDDPPTAEVSSG